MKEKDIRVYVEEKFEQWEFEMLEERLIYERLEVFRFNPNPNIWMRYQRYRFYLNFIQN